MRDPLVALGCQDAAARVVETKENDTRRQDIVDLFLMWRDKHGDRPVAVRDLDFDITRALDPQNRGRQHLAARLQKLVGTRVAGFMLTRQQPVGTWGAATYALTKTGADGDRRAHRGHGGNGSCGPYAPDAY